MLGNWLLMTLSSHYQIFVKLRIAGMFLKNLDDFWKGGIKLQGSRQSVRKDIRYIR